MVPQDVLCVPLDSRSIKISWSIVGPKSQIIDGFYVGFKPMDSMLPFTYKTMQTTGAFATGSAAAPLANANDHMTSKYEYTIDSLARRTKYM